MKIYIIKHFTRAYSLNNKKHSCSIFRLLHHTVEWHSKMRRTKTRKNLQRNNHETLVRTSSSYFNYYYYYYLKRLAVQGWEREINTNQSEDPVPQYQP